MNWIDFWVVAAVAAFIFLVIAFGPLKRRIREAKHDDEPVSKACPNCPMGYDKKALRLVRDFRKAKKIEEEEKKKRGPQD